MNCPLNPEELDYVKRTWTVAAGNIHQVGEVVFYKFFEKHPSYIIQFPKFQNSTLPQLKNSQAFKNHGYLIMCQIGESVALLGTPEGWAQIREAWYAHGDMHIPLKVRKQQFMQFRDVAIQQILEISNLTHVDEVRKAWIKFFNAIFSYSFEHSGAQ